MFKNIIVITLLIFFSTVNAEEYQYWENWEWWDETFRDSNYNWNNNDKNKIKKTKSTSTDKKKQNTDSDSQEESVSDQPNIESNKQWDLLKNWLIKSSKNNILNRDEDDWLSILWAIAKWLKDILSWFIVLIAIWVFLYIWIKLATARWNPEEFQKSMKHFIYAIIWIFITSIAYAWVTLIAWIKF